MVFMLACPLIDLKSLRVSWLKALITPL